MTLSVKKFVVPPLGGSHGTSGFRHGNHKSDEISAHKLRLKEGFIRKGLSPALIIVRTGLGQGCKIRAGVTKVAEKMVRIPLLMNPSSYTKSL